MKQSFLVFLLIVFPLFLWASDELSNAIKKQEKVLAAKPEDKEALKKISFLYLNKAEYDQAIKYGTKLQNLAYDQLDYYYVMYSHICLGQAYVMKGDQEKAYNNLHQALENSKYNKNDTALCSVYNGLGLYESNIKKDYYRSLNYLFRGLAVAKKSKIERMYSLLLCNISGIYYLKNDTIGLKYSLECYNRGHEMRDPFLIFIGSVNSAFMYLLKQEYDKAINFIKEGEFVMLQNDINDQTNVYSLYGHILSAKGNDNSAITYFKKALSLKESGQTSSIMHAYLGYSNILIKQKKYQEAISLLKEGIKLSYANNNAIYRSDLLQKLSECYQTSGQLSDALETYRRYQSEVDSLFNVEKERDLSDLRIKYDIQKHENDVKESKLAVLQKEKKMQFLVVVLVGFVIIAGLLYYLYTRKNTLYKAIVRQHQEAIKRQDQLLKQVQKEEEVPYNAHEKYSVSSLSTEKSQTLFSQLEKVMRQDKIYSDNMLTKEKLADILGTNRTYLSQVINEQAGIAFTQYLNNFRIDEAIRILSDPKDETPLKAISSDLGFNSMTTFYNLFHKSVGMTPAQYRKQVKQLENS